jgi:hypothetical protein
MQHAQQMQGIGIFLFLRQNFSFSYNCPAESQFPCLVHLKGIASVVNKSIIFSCTLLLLATTARNNAGLLVSKESWILRLGCWGTGIEENEWGDDQWYLIDPRIRLVVLPSSVGACNPPAILRPRTPGSQAKKSRKLLEIRPLDIALQR